MWALAICEGRSNKIVLVNYVLFLICDIAAWLIFPPTLNTILSPSPHKKANFWCCLLLLSYLRIWFSSFQKYFLNRIHWQYSLRNSALLSSILKNSALLSKSWNLFKACLVSFRSSRRFPIGSQRYWCSTGWWSHLEMFPSKRTSNSSPEMEKRWRSPRFNIRKQVKPYFYNNNNINSFFG